MDEIKKLKKKIRKEIDGNIEVHPDSDLPVSEKRVKEKKTMK